MVVQWEHKLHVLLGGSPCIRTPGQPSGEVSRSDFVRTIVLVDDEERDLEAVSGVLESAGYKVCRAASYTDAVLCMEKFGNIPDLLVTDIALPEVNGVELYRKLSKMTGVWLNVLFISAYSGAEVLKVYQLPISDVHS